MSPPSSGAAVPPSRQEDHNKEDLVSSTSQGNADAVEFPDGIPGFPTSRRFTLVALSADSDFQVLQSLDEPDVSLIVTVPWTFFPDYAPEIEEDDRAALDIAAPEDAVVFCPVTLEAATRSAYLNLMGPFVVNARTRIGRQLVLAGSDHPLRAPIDLGGS